MTPSFTRNGAKTLIMVTSTVTRLGDFLNFLETNLLSKVFQIFW